MTTLSSVATSGSGLSSIAPSSGRFSVYQSTPLRLLGYQMISSGRDRAPSSASWHLRTLTPRYKWYWGEVCDLLTRVFGIRVCAIKRATYSKLTCPDILSNDV